MKTILLCFFCLTKKKQFQTWKMKNTRHKRCRFQTSSTLTRWCCSVRIFLQTKLFNRFDFFILFWLQLYQSFTTKGQKKHKLPRNRGGFQNDLLWFLRCKIQKSYLFVQFFCRFCLHVVGIAIAQKKTNKSTKICVYTWFLLWK